MKKNKILVTMLAFLFVFGITCTAFAIPATFVDQLPSDYYIDEHGDIQALPQTRGEYPPSVSTSLPYSGHANILNQVYTNRYWKGPSSGKLSVYVNAKITKGSGNTTLAVELWSKSGSKIGRKFVPVIDSKTYRGTVSFTGLSQYENYFIFFDHVRGNNDSVVDFDFTARAA